VVIVTEPGTSGLPFRSYLEPEDVHLNIDPATTLRPQVFHQTRFFHRTKKVARKRPFLLVIEVPVAQLGGSMLRTRSRAEMNQT
jgi:hypothetical protein